MRTLTRTAVRRLGVLLGLAVGLTLALTVSAGATPPTTFRAQFDETSVEDWSVAACGFAIVSHLVGTAAIEVLRDQSGNATRVQIHANGTDTFSANAWSR